MAFEKTLVTAKAKSFAVTDDGFVLDEAHLNNIETELTRLELAETALTAANTTLGVTNTELDNSKISLVNANATVLTQSTRITELEAQVAELGKQSSGSGTVLTKEKDDSAEAPKVAGTLGINNPNHPLNQYAASVVASKKKKQAA